MKRIFDLLRNKRLYQNKTFDNEFTEALSNTLKKNKLSERDMNKYYREAEEGLNSMQNFDLDVIKDEKNLFRDSLIKDLEHYKEKYKSVQPDEISTRMRQDKNARYKLNPDIHRHLDFQVKQYKGMNNYMRKVLEENKKKK